MPNRPADRSISITVYFTAVAQEQKQFQVRNAEADRIMQKTIEMLPKISEGSLRYRLDEMLKPFLKDKSVPDEQKQEILDFIKTHSHFGKVSLIEVGSRRPPTKISCMSNSPNSDNSDEGGGSQ